MSFGGFGSFGSFGQSYGLGTNGFEVSLNYITGVPDPNVLTSSSLKLIFKALMKRDDTTREKAIADLTVFFDSNTADLDDLALISWCQLYAKLSSDSSKKVRLTAHQIQGKLVSLLGKKYVKYLRDTVGIWMSGCFESDKVVSKGTVEAISAAFGGSPEKTNNLWKIFSKQLLTYCHQLLVYETVDTLSDERFVGKDESLVKFNRSVNTAIQMLISLVTRYNNEEIQLDDTVLTELIESDSFLAFFESKDLQIKKGMYILLQRLLQTEVDPEIFKHLVKSAFKGLKLEKINPILYSGVIITLLEAILSIYKYDASVVASVKKSEQRIFDLLKLGSLNSDPSYYTILSFLLDQLPKDTATQESVLSILETDVSNEKFAPFIQHSWICYIGYCQKLSGVVDRIIKQLVVTLDSRRLLPNVVSGISGVSKIASDTEDVLLDLNSEIMNALPGRVIEFVDLEVSVKNQTIFIDNYVRVLLEAGSDYLDDLVTNAVESLTDVQDEYEPPVLAFDIISTVVKSNSVQFRPQIEIALQYLPKCITPQFLEPVLNLLLNISKSKFNLELLDTVSTIADQLQESDLELLLKYVAQIPNFDLSQCERLNTYIHEKSSSSDTDDVMFKFLTVDVLENMFSRLPEDGFAGFVHKCNLHFQNDVFVPFANNASFMAALWKSSSNSDSRQLLDKLEKNLGDEEFENVYLSSLKANLAQIDEEALQQRLANYPKETVVKLIPEDLVDELEKCVGENPDQRLAISNKLGLAVYLFPGGGLLDQPAKFWNLFVKADFYLQLAEKHQLLTDSLIFQLGMIAEVAQDYLFLGLLENETKINQFQALVASKWEYAQGQLDQFVQNDHLAIYGVSGRSPSLQFYCSRFWVVILTNIFETMQLSVFNTYNFNKVTDSVKLATLVISANKFLTASSFDRLRNQTCAELVGVRGSSIVSRGLHSLLLLTLFIDLDLDSVPDQFQLFPAQRFGMMLNGLSGWPDSELAYESSFVPVRTVLSRFVELYIKNIYYVCDSDYPSDFIDKVFSLGAGLCSDSLSMLNSGETDLILEYQTLKTFTVLHQHSEKIDWDENELFSDLVDILFKPMHSGQIELLIQSLIGRIFVDIVPTSSYKPRFDDLLPLVSSPNIESQKLGVSLLHKLVPEIQDELVVEATLNQDEETKLPEPLVNNTTLLPDEDQAALNKFLWSWYLIFDHFKNITQKIRQDYISEIGEDRFGQFLDFIFDMDLKPTEDNKRAILHYSVATGDEDDLIYHLMYLFCKYVGGSTAQTWFQSLRNKQHKSQVETFVTKNISPLLIDETLAGLSQKGNLEDSEFSIKLNRTTNEVRCIYEIDEQKLEMTIMLPNNYPLSAITVNGASRLGVDEKKWKSWILSCQYVINFQNGTILEAIQHFKNNVKANFDNYEDCAVCYSILHVIDHSTPNKVCSTYKVEAREHARVPEKRRADVVYRANKLDLGDPCQLTDHLLHSVCAQRVAVDVVDEQDQLHVLALLVEVVLDIGQCFVDVWSNGVLNAEDRLLDRREQRLDTEIRIVPVHNQAFHVLGPW
ncbi:hypothetical protein OGAPHI_003230 [Ogataea philodendri]|uniref:E3 ubiquitin-protein ligase listerin n=2 Tax=Ogataea TaxID=461281 RepID=A0A9P8T5G5_9ASCO|nr:uncharacterized protein OGAPHI_003230 [Ogataea philodendri]KAH3666781.1 hypothetical protein OGAPHI_003230 [Ogataea philodendri]